tara:strand:- start:7959 stop:8369 length:411 start_codon:yes stop_codon:yes gene_type:complete
MYACTLCGKLGHNARLCGRNVPVPPDAALAAAAAGEGARALRIPEERRKNSEPDRKQPTPFATTKRVKVKAAYIVGLKTAITNEKRAKKEFIDKHAEMKRTLCDMMNLLDDASVDMSEGIYKQIAEGMMSVHNNLI